MALLDTSQATTTAQQAMPLLTPLHVPRTKVSTHNPINYDSGRGQQGFHAPGSPFSAWELIPHDNKWSDGTPSFMAPVSHYHLLQTESFHVDSGSGYWFLRGRKIRLAKGDEITIPRFVAHRFESVPNEKEEPLVISYRYQTGMVEMEERFFRNTLTYLDDCRKAGVSPSLPQLCLFLADCWMPGEFVPCSWLLGEYGACFVNALFMWIMAAIGMVVFGYRRSYREYYDPEISTSMNGRAMRRKEREVNCLAAEVLLR